MAYYDDDGNLIDITQIPTPELCKKCVKFDQMEEAIPCNLNRMDQRKKIAEGNKFVCYAFQPEK